MTNRNGHAYDWYVLGCERLNWPVLSEAEFWPQYQSYTRYKRFLDHVPRWLETNPDGTTRVRFKQGTSWTAQLFSKVVTLFRPLVFVATAIEVGRGTDGGAGAPVRSYPRSPVLVGAGAKLHPDLDPEPRWRDEVI